MHSGSMGKYALVRSANKPQPKLPRCKVVSSAKFRKLLTAAGYSRQAIVLAIRYGQPTDVGGVRYRAR